MFNNRPIVTAAILSFGVAWLAALSSVSHPSGDAQASQGVRIRFPQTYANSSPELTSLSASVSAAN